MSVMAGVPWRRAAVLLVCIVLLAARSSAVGAEEASPAGSEDADSIEYQLRPNDDPSKVARMFHVTLDELLALNHISDPRRLTVGTTLKIPDPRAERVKQLAAEKHSIEEQLTGAQASVRALQDTKEQLQSQLADLREENAGLRSEQTFYHVWRVAVFVSAGAAAALALGLLLVWARARDAERHAALLLKEAEVIHAALEKYRQLGGQFELKYQSLFHQVGTPSPMQARAHALRAAYEEDRARLDVIVAEAERQINAALANLSPKREQAHAAARLAAVPAARKSG